MTKVGSSDLRTREKTLLLSEIKICNLSFSCLHMYYSFNFLNLLVACSMYAVDPMNRSLHDVIPSHQV